MVDFDKIRNDLFDQLEKSDVLKDEEFHKGIYRSVATMIARALQNYHNQVQETSSDTQNN